MTPRLPRPVVVDASALLERLLGGRRGDATAQATGDSPMMAPHHVDVEILNALRRLRRSDEVREGRAAELVSDLRDAPLERIDTTELIPRIWELRDILSPYDAAYVALAQVLNCALITADARLGRAVATSVAVVVV